MRLQQTQPAIALAKTRAGEDPLFANAEPGFHRAFPSASQSGGNGVGARKDVDDAGIFSKPQPATPPGRSSASRFWTGDFYREIGARGPHCGDRGSGTEKTGATKARRGKVVGRGGPIPRGWAAHCRGLGPNHRRIFGWPSITQVSDFFHPKKPRLPSLKKTVRFPFSGPTPPPFTRPEPRCSPRHSHGGRFRPRLSRASARKKKTRGGGDLPKLSNYGPAIPISGLFFPKGQGARLEGFLTF